MRDDAYLLIALVQTEQNHLDDATATYVELRSRTRSPAHAAEAGFKQAELMVRSGRSERIVAARDILTEIADNQPDSEWAPKALALKARIEAREPLRKQEDVSSGGGRGSAGGGARAGQGSGRNSAGAQSEVDLWRLAISYVDARRPVPAIQTLTQLVTRFPQTQFEAWWLLGELLSRSPAPDAADRARKAYARVPPASLRYAEAQQKLKAR